jgi:cyclic dehypoxanthinyl futalosine synthase
MKTETRIVEKILERALSGERLNLEDGILLHGADLNLLGRAASLVRNRLHDPERVTFVVDRNISYTNACVADCDFCAFYVSPLSKDVYVLSEEKIFEKIRELEAIQGTQILLQGGLNPKLRIDFYVNLLRRIRENFPNITIHSFSPTEIDFIAKLEKKPVSEIFRILKEAGLHSMPGGGGEILVQRVRDIISPKKISADRWLEVQREAHLGDLKTTATMVIGHVETVEERIIHLLRLRELQDETQGFRAFIAWTMSTHGTKLSHIKKVSGEDYLRIVALARLIFDNVPHIQSGWVTEGHKLAQTALAFGADDMGGVLMEEEVVSKTGVAHTTCIADMLRLIRSAGFEPFQRNTRYEIVRTFPTVSS